MVRNPISDAVTRIKNGYRANLPEVEMPKSNKVQAVMEALAKYGYVGKVRIENNLLKVELKYSDKEPAVMGIRNMSIPGQKMYVPYKSIPKVWGGLGVNILSTSKGVMGDKDAKKAKIGGELLCQVW